jgi:hypothetical protein
MKTLTWIAGFALLVATAGCQYESPVPIAPAVAGQADTALIGAWRSVAGVDGDTTLTVVIVRFDSVFQLIHAAALGEEENGYMRAHTTRVGPARFLNLELLGETERKYWIYRYALEGDRLRVRALKEGVGEKIGTTANLRTFLLANLENDSIYDTAMEFRRLPKKDSQ